MKGVLAFGRDPAVWILGIGLLVLYGPLLPELVRDWSGNGDFSHGFLVPVVTVWLIHQRREELAAAESRPFLLGGALLLAAVLQYLLGVAGSEFYLQRTSMVTFLGGWILLLWGPVRARLLVFPVAFLLFMIPPPSIVWTSISFPLQLLASRITEATLLGAGVEVQRAGNVIHLENCSLEVAAACSGLRSLVTLLAMGAVLAEGSLVVGGPRAWPLKWILFLLGIPVAVAVNAIRVSGTAFAAVRFGPEVATGWIHDASGILMFTLSLGLLWLGRWTLQWTESYASLRRS